MKKEYETPVMTISRFHTENVVTVSSGVDMVTSALKGGSYGLSDNQIVTVDMITEFNN